MVDEKRHAQKIVLLGGGLADEQRQRLLSQKDMEDDDETPILGGFSEKKFSANLRLRKWLMGVLICLCALLVVINSVFTYGQITTSWTSRLSNHILENELITEVNSSVEILPQVATVPGFVVKTSGCRIPAFDVMDSSIEQFFKDSTPFKCDVGTHLPLVSSNMSTIFVDENAKHHFYGDSETVDCCWRKFWRTDQNDNSVTYDKTCQNFDNSTDVSGSSAEFVKVECRKNQKEIYKDYFSFVPRKLQVEKRCNGSPHPGPETGRLNILILGLDAVSRLNFHRTMPKTVKILQDLGAVEMLGYNKVADNTFPNMIPVLTGLSEKELSQNCWTSKKKTFDDCRFLWNNYSEAGYRTVLGEDACGMSIFNYLKSGFKNPPTDYYLRPFCVASEKDIGNTHKLNADLCVGTRKTFDNLLGYGDKIAKEFSDDSYFAFFWQASLTHDFVHYPKFGDESYSKFIRESSENGIIDKTALIVMSDHGIRWGGFRQTYQGHVEESLPFVFILLPRWWRQKYPGAWATLRKNSKSLTTPFDLHETLLHLLNPGELEEDALNVRNEKIEDGERTPRGISWFIPVPDSRTCLMAGIPGHWCMCHLSQNTSLTDPIVKKAVDFLVDQLNNMIADYPQCAKLKVKSIIDAKSWADKSRTKPKEKAAPSIDYTVTVQTEPGDAIFEGTVRHKTKDSKQKLVGSVSRLNLYGEQSACVDDFKMRLYCYCR